MAWTTVSTQISGTTVTATLWNEFANNFLHLEEIAYAEITSNVTVTATTAATAQTVVSSGSLTYEAVPHMIEFFSESITVGTSGSLFLTLWDGSTDLGRIGHYNSPSGGSINVPYSGSRRITPTAASHEYIVKAYRATANGAVVAGAGGVDTPLPAFIRIYKVIT